MLLLVLTQYVFACFRYFIQSPLIVKFSFLINSDCCGHRKSKTFDLYDHKIFQKLMHFHYSQSKSSYRFQKTLWKNFPSHNLSYFFSLFFYYFLRSNVFQRIYYVKINLRRLIFAKNFYFIKPKFCKLILLYRISVKIIISVHIAPAKKSIWSRNYVIILLRF